MKKKFRHILICIVALIVFITLFASGFMFFAEQTNGVVFSDAAFAAYTYSNIPTVQIQPVSATSIRPYAEKIRETELYKQVCEALHSDAPAYIQVDDEEKLIEVLCEIKYSMAPSLSQIIKFRHADDPASNKYADGTYVLFDTGKGLLLRINPPGREVVDDNLIERHLKTAKTWIREAGIRQGMDQYKAVLMIIHMLQSKLEYDDRASRYTWMQAMDTGKTVCQGYAETFSVMCNICGIDGGCVLGQNKDGVYHEWNWINIGGNKLYVDVTWAACMSDTRLQNFCGPDINQQYAIVEESEGLLKL